MSKFAPWLVVRRHAGFYLSSRLRLREWDRSKLGIQQGHSTVPRKGPVPWKCVRSSKGGREWVLVDINISTLRKRSIELLRKRDIAWRQWHILAEW